jgi:hypothetical protein
VGAQASRTGYAAYAATYVCAGGDGDEPVTGDLVNKPLFGGESPFLTSPYDVPYSDFGTSAMVTPFSSFLNPRHSLPHRPRHGKPLITDSSPLISCFGDDLDLFGAAAALPNVELTVFVWGPAAPGHLSRCIGMSLFLSLAPISRSSPAIHPLVVALVLPRIYRILCPLLAILTMSHTIC